MNTTASTAAVSVVIITRDSENRISPTLKSALNYVDDVYVFVDNRTRDNTASIAESFGAHVREIKNNGYFEDVYEEAVNLVPSKWILRIDDDEILTPNNKANNQKSHLAGLINSAELHDANLLFIPRRWMLPGGSHFISSMFWWPDPSKRLFRKVDGIVWPKRIHDDIVVPGNTGFVSSVFIDHYDFVYNEKESRERKMKRYAEARPEWTGEITYIYENYSFSVSPIEYLPAAEVIEA